MIGSEPGFSACLAACARARARATAEPDGDDPTSSGASGSPGRNLGLVPIDDPGSFAWPGYWIAAADGAGRATRRGTHVRRPVRDVLDPAGLLARGGSLVEGAVVAPFQLGLDWRCRTASRPTRAASSRGCWSRPRPEAPLGRVEAAEAVAGAGSRATATQRRGHVLGHRPRLRADADRGRGARGARSRGRRGHLGAGAPQRRHARHRR